MGDQPQAIETMVRLIESGAKHQTLLGVTVLSKTFTMANIIERTQKPTLVIAHNKTPGISFMVNQRVFSRMCQRYFVSYYRLLSARSL